MCSLLLPSVCLINIFIPALTMPSGSLITAAHWSVFGNDALSLAVLSHVVLVLCADWPHVAMVTNPLRIQCLEIEIDHVAQCSF